jgi:DNA (cytosine-5)-methyltransferase 1
VGNAVNRYLSEARKNKRRQSGRQPTIFIPKNPTQALRWLRPLIIAAEQGTLNSVSRSDFRLGWSAIGFIHNGLHPDSVNQSGNRLIMPHSDMSVIEKSVPEVIRPAFELSGWPVKLVPIAKEAQARLREAKLSANEYYCSEAQMAGARWVTRAGSV